MPNSLVTQHYPDDFQIVCVSIPGSASDPTALMYADRDLVIDSVVFGIRAVGTSSTSNNEVKIEVATGLNLATGSELCTFSTDGTTPTAASGDTIVSTTDGVVRVNSTGVSQAVGSSTKLDSNVNLVKAGQWVVADLVGTDSSLRAMVQIRFRSRVN